MLKLRKNKDSENGTDKQSLSVNNPQGITAKGNALKTVVLLALISASIPIAVGFSYLALMREPALQEAQVIRVAASFATQQATNLHRMFTRLAERMNSAAISPLALSAIASQSSEDIKLVEQAMLDYFPELVSLKIVPIDDMGTAEIEGSEKGLRNHIEVDLVRRTGAGEETQPEAYRFENRWLTSMAALIKHPRIPGRNAVIIATMDNDQISQTLRSLDSSSGKFVLEQPFTAAGGGLKVNIIALAGSGDGSDYIQRADVPGTPWRVAFTPSRTLLDQLYITPWPLFGVMALSLTAMLLAISVILLAFPRRLEGEINKVISAADRKTPLEISIPELVGIAKQLRRATLRALRQSNVKASPELPVAEVQEEFEIQGATSDLTNPMFQSKNIIDEDEDNLGLQLGDEDALPTESKRKESPLPDHIFRAYDIRGHADRELKDTFVSQIGKAIGSIAGEMDEQTMVVGCDGRISSARIKSALIRALMESGRDVIDIGLVPTPLLYFATRHLNCKSGIMVTGSHNPAEYNGLKIVLQQQTIAAGGIQQIRDRVAEQKFSKGNGRMIREDLVPAYMEEVLHDIAIAVPLKLVIDAGNGATGSIAPQLFEDLGCEVVPLYCDVDGNFPNHPPDTSNENNLADLVQEVRVQDADFGVAFDGDGDRLAVVTPSGNIVRSDILLMIYAQDVVSRNPGADVVFDVKCSRNLSELVSRHGGRPVLWKTGHAFMKEKMAETGALLGGEFSGHMFFGERWYGFDDGMYAAGRLAEILSTHGNSLDDLVAAFPETVNTPEILIAVPDETKFELMEKIVANADFSSGKINTMDGIRVDFADGWGLLRASNTGPALTARFEANTQESLEAIQAEFRAQIALVDPELELNF